MQVIAQHYQTADADFGRHRDAYGGWLERVAPYPALKVNSQTGKDHFTFAQNRQLIALADRFSARTGLPVLHETHRGKFSFAAHVTATYLHKLPELRLTLDASHWCAVAESLLGDQPEAMALAIARTDHLHARVGHAQGPQAVDPRCPEWHVELERHLQWWDAVAEAKRRLGGPLTVTPEFGPHPYLVHYSDYGPPLASQWAVNVWVMGLLRQRWAATEASA